MSEISIKIKIGERIYPMKVKEEDEARIREASKIINDRIAKYMNKFGIGDKQDLLAMVAFDCLIEKSSVEKNQNNKIYIDRLESLMARMDGEIANGK